MAITENRGGANGGAQYNPNKIDVSGGRGQNPKNMELKYREMGYGTTGQINTQANLAPGVAGTVGAASRPMPRGMMGAIPAGKGGAPVVPITAASQFPDETIFSGSTVPGGMNFEDLNLPVGPVGDPDLDAVAAYYPVMRYWANQPDTPDATKEYVRFLGTIFPR